MQYVTQRKLHAINCQLLITILLRIYYNYRSCWLNQVIQVSVLEKDASVIKAFLSFKNLPTIYFYASISIIATECKQSIGSGEILQLKQHAGKFSSFD